MTIDLSPIAGQDGETLSFEGTISFPEFSFRESTLADAVFVSGQVKNLGGEYELSAKLIAPFHLTCGRCLRSFQKNFEFFMEEHVGKGDNSDYLKLSQHHLDLTDAIYTHLMVNLSGKYVCQEDCKGLCTVCGADLNQVECGCDRDITDPRFDVLKNLLK